VKIHCASIYFLIAVGCLSWAFSGCSPSKKDSAPTSNGVQEKNVAIRSQSCDEITRNLICVTDYLPEVENPPGNFLPGIKKQQDRSCKSGHEDYKDYFMQVYKMTPEPVQKLICGVSVIYLVEGENVPYGGQVSYIYDINDVKNEKVYDGYKSYDLKAIGQYLSISVHYRIKNKETCADAAQRRFNARFGFASDFSSKQILPQYAFENDSPACDFVKTLIHEAGHIFDFANDVMSHHEDWVSKSFVETDGDYPRAKAGPLLFSANPLDSTQAKELLVEFNQSPFVTFYALNNPMEDFAEEFVNMFGEYKYSFVDLDGTKLVDIQNNNVTVDTRICKISYVSNVYNSPDIKFSLIPKYVTIYESENTAPLSHSGHDR
jgi:hypothetical protein